MKKIFVASLFLGLASMAQANYIQCQLGNLLVVDQGTGLTSTTATCSPAAGGGAGSSDDNLAGDGWTVTNINLRVNGSQQDSAGTLGQFFSVVHTTANGAGIPEAQCITSGNADSNGNTGGLCASPGLGLAVNTDVFAAFTVTVTGAAGSNPLPANATATVFYQVTATQDAPPSIPEPSTYAMMAAGLVSFYLVRRKS